MVRIVGVRSEVHSAETLAPHSHALLKPAVLLIETNVKIIPSPQVTLSADWNEKVKHVENEAAGWVALSTGSLYSSLPLEFMGLITPPLPPFKTYDGGEGL